MRRRRLAGLGLAVLATSAVSVSLLLRPGPEAILALCSATAGPLHFELSPEQGANATTIAAEAARLGLPDHAVSVGLAAALQESRLQNLDYGDRDSLGLFQQRPSQGWGTPAQLLQPSYAAAAFFRGLIKVPGWESLQIYLAAQRVQRSADPAAYATWDTEARTIARGLTGEVPAGWTCRYPRVPASGPDTGTRLARDVSAAFGPDALPIDSPESLTFSVTSLPFTLLLRVLATSSVRGLALGCWPLTSGRNCFTVPMS